MILFSSCKEAEVFHYIWRSEFLQNNKKLSYFNIYINPKLLKMKKCSLKILVEWKILEEKKIQKHSDHNKTFKNCIWILALSLVRFLNICTYVVV